MKQRVILHIDMDCFFAAVEERENPRFQGRPVVVGADPVPEKVRYGAGPNARFVTRATGRGVVSTCNYEARKYGIHSAMPISQAWRLCPQAVFLPVNGELYRGVSKRIMRIIQCACSGCPVEQVSLDEAYVDLSDLVKNYNTIQYYSFVRTFAEKLKLKIWRKEKLTCTIGIGPNKMVAKIACEKAKPPHQTSCDFYQYRAQRAACSGVGVKPNGVLVVKPREVQRFLGPLSVRDIPGVGPKTASFLSALIRLSYPQLNRIKEPRVEDIRKVSLAKLRERLGKHGEVLYEQVRGIDESPVMPEEEAKSLGKEHTFEKDTRDGEEIFSVFRELQKDVFQELKREKLAFKTITVVCRFLGFETHTKSKTVQGSSRDKELLKKESSRLLLKFLVENPKPVRLVGLRLRIAPAAH